MKSTIRQGVFETNSSSTHCLCICTEEEYEKFIKGELVWELYTNKLVTPEKTDYKSSTLYYKKDAWGTEPDATTTYTSPSGDKLVGIYYEFYH